MKQNDEAAVFLSLDFIYTPTPDVDQAIEFYVDRIGAKLVWRIQHGNTIVANVKLSSEGPALLLANHLEGQVPLLIYRVSNLKTLMAKLKNRGWESDGEPFEIPHGPCVTFHDPGGQRFALYELARPEADAHLALSHRETN